MKDMNLRPMAAFAAILATVVPVHAQQDAAWKGLQFLVGNWIGVAGEKDTPIGAGQGAFSFEPQLNQKIIVRHNVAEYNSGARHDDLMVIYLDPTPKAIYWDSEGHVIRYNVNLTGPERVVFESDAREPGPRYRLSYWMESGKLNGKFELALSGGDFKDYMKWQSKRKN